MDTSEYKIQLVKSGSFGIDDFEHEYSFKGSDDLRAVLEGIDLSKYMCSLQIGKNSTIVLGVNDITVDFIVSIFESSIGGVE